AICSCERAYSLDTCTVAALDAITAFAVPNPNRWKKGSLVRDDRWLIYLQAHRPPQRYQPLRPLPHGVWQTFFTALSGTHHGGSDLGHAPGMLIEMQLHRVSPQKCQSEANV